jgi:hypothetical protein
MAKQRLTNFLKNSGDEQGGAPERAVRACSNGRVTRARPVTLVVTWPSAMSPLTPTDNGPDRITAAPGTDEYDRQFRRQALHAADGALALWIVRIPCGVFALWSVVMLFMLWFHWPDGDLRSLLEDLYLALCGIWCAIEFGTVALRGRSLYFQSLLSTTGLRQRQVPDDGDAK